MEENLTSGSVFKKLLFFSLPFLLSYFLQTLYGMADLFIIGQFGSVADITAVSVGSQVMHMLTVMLVGLAMGATVVIGQNIGAKQADKAACAVGNTVILFVGVAGVATAVLLLCTENIVQIMATPYAAVQGTKNYLFICFMGVPFITAYNVISSILRGMGDSKSPMYFIAVSCAANIALDYLFMGVFRMGPAGAALSTTLSQTISVLLALCVILKRKLGVPMHKTHFKPHFSVIGQILKGGIPVALQDGFIQISFILITIIANNRGLNDAAAVGIVEKIISILFLIPSTMLSSISALCAQNIGAKKPERAKLTLRYAIFITVGFGVIITLFTELFADSIVGIFADDASVMRLGGQYLKSYVFDCIFAGIHFCFSGYFCALGKSGISFLHNVLSIILVRVPGAYFTSLWFAESLFPMGLAAPLGSLLSVIICWIAYVILNRRKVVDKA